MDCNRDEAVRAKEIAEKKLLNDDVTEAKRFALKAQRLFPELEGLPQFIEVIDLYVAYDNKINGVANYYAILGVDPYAGEETLRKQYKRRALALHPDKNRSVGADGAFKLLSEAWETLSDKGIKAAYDLKLNIRAPSQTGSSSSSVPRNTTANATPQHASTTTANPQHVPTRPRSAMTPNSSDLHVPMNRVPDFDFDGSPFTPFISEILGNQGPAFDNHHAHFRNPQMNPSYQTTPPTAAPQSIPVRRPRSRRPPVRNPVPTTSNARPVRPRSRRRPVRNPVPTTSNARPVRPRTFWTSCSSCRFKFEYHWRLVNRNLLCIQCNQPFLATMIPAPSEDIPRRRPSPLPQQQQHMSAASSSGSRSGPASDAKNTGAASGPPPKEGSKRRREENDS